MVTLSILGSGSGGNAAVLATSRTRVLLDVGFSRREMLRRMLLAGYAPEQLDGVLITHEHGDHVCGLPRLAEKLAAPVYLNEGTRAALGAAGGALPRPETIAAGVSFQIGDIEVTPFSVPHDAADTLAFCFRAEGVRIAFVTDLGYLAPHVLERLRGADCLVLESNHDLEMLKNGGYPWALKQRVASRLGHLSNHSLAEFLHGQFDGAAAHVVLAHLSENNNLPSLAMISAQRALAPRARVPQIHLARQDRPLGSINF
ncbi:MAG TPA: MBL fold metallo-hydrolase [Terriglobales bacterium]|nr:MBL fold metallo-hydrolase [Terriglobales bacterium]